MKHKMRWTSALLATTLSSVAIGDQYVVMPDGGGCWIPSNGGVAYGCSGGNSGNSAADRAHLMEARNARERMKLYQECLRTSDWPGKPSRSECATMYGQ